MILTDSGGLSKESVFAGASCLFMLDLKIWPDLERIRWLKHIDFDNDAGIRSALDVIHKEKTESIQVDFYGNRHTAKKIVDALEELF